MTKLQNLIKTTKSYGKYTAGSYLDGALSLGLSLLEKGYDVKDGINGKSNFNIHERSWDSIKKYVPGYNLRERLRDSMDTKPGMLYLQSNLVGAIPFFGVGIPAAEMAKVGIEKLMPGESEILKNAINSCATLASQFIFFYGGFMVNEVKTNKYKYVNEKGKLSSRKVLGGLAKFVKAGLSFDIPYAGAKLAGQTYLLLEGKDPWQASALFDATAAPAWYSIAIPLGLKYGIIETRFTENEKEISTEQGGVK